MKFSHSGNEFIQLSSHENLRKLVLPASEVRKRRLGRLCNCKLWSLEFPQDSAPLEVQGLR